MMIYARRSVIKIYAPHSLAKYILISKATKYAHSCVSEFMSTNGLIVSYALLFVRH